MLFKAQLFALTGVQPERQKVMLKGVTLKDDDWSNFKLRDVCYFLPHILLKYLKIVNLRVCFFTIYLKC